MKTLFLLAVLCFVLASSINLERLSSVNVEQQRALNPGKQALPTQEKGQKVKSSKYTSIATKKFPESKQDPSKAQAVESALKNKAKSKPAAPKYKKVDPVILAAVKAGLGEYGRVVEGAKDNKELNGIAFGWDVKEKKPVLTFSFKKGKGAKCPGTVPKTVLCTAVEEEVDEKAFARLEIGDMVVAHGQQASVGACLTTGLPPAGSGDYIVSSWHGHAQRYDDVIEPLRPETVGWISTWPMPPHVGNNDFDLAYLTAGHTCVCPGKPIATESAASLDEFVAAAAQAAAENYEPKLTVEGAWMGQKDLAATAKLNLRQILRSYTAANVGIQFTNMIRVEFELGSPNPGDSGGALYIEGALLGITSGGGHSGINHWGYFTPIWNVADALKANANHLNFC